MIVKSAFSGVVFRTSNERRYLMMPLGKEAGSRPDSRPDSRQKHCQNRCRWEEAGEPLRALELLFISSVWSRYFVRVGWCCWIRHINTINTE